MDAATTTKPTLVFDGDCSFCTSAANFAKRHLEKLELIPWQRANLATYGLTEEQASRRVYLVLESKKFAGHACFAKLLRLHPNPLLWIAGALMVVPPISWLAMGIYYLVARFRHRLPGGTPACKL